MGECVKKKKSKATLGGRVESEKSVNPLTRGTLFLRQKFNHCCYRALPSLFGKTS